MQTRIGVLGADGRMGRAIVRAIAANPSARLVAAVERAGAPSLGQDAGLVAGVSATKVLIQEGLPHRGVAQVWVDFSVPAASLAAAETAAIGGVAMVIGTTGLSPAQKADLAAAARAVPIVFAANTSVGVNVLLKTVGDVARALGPGYDLEIVEAHHRNKRDAPSGTALRLAEALAEATKRDLGATARYDRHGEIGPRTDAEIGIQTVRGGDVVGDHTVFFLGNGERIEITHRATSRDTFAHGAVRAALWVEGQKPGLYDFRDVLGF
ncbi:MAG TPA: 4-hydroxy-tetrahydrodipicolinate reductase [Polyangia bacterium]|nr:4-hydroxy-tetrahydrodipicolinate reductase [Polyangia bacterium]